MDALPEEKVKDKLRHSDGIDVLLVRAPPRSLTGSENSSVKDTASAFCDLESK